MFSFHHPDEGFEPRSVGLIKVCTTSVASDHFPPSCTLEVKLCQKSLSCNIKTEETTIYFNKKFMFA